MDSTALAKLFRTSVVFDNVEPYLWSDSEVYSYMDRAVRKFCVEVRGIADANTTEITEVMVVTGEMYSPIDPRVMQVRSMFNVTSNVDMQPFNSLEIGEKRLRQGGAVIGYSFNDEDNKVRWNAVPQADEVVQMSVYRFPLESITGKACDIELPEEHHEALMDWMAHLAYLKHDPETYDPQRSDAAAGRFLDYCKHAREELSRKRHARRGVRYGGL